MPAVSKSQQRIMGMAHACQKYGKCASKKVKDLAANIKPKDAEDFAKTKHKGLPERKRKAKKKHMTFEQFLQQRDPNLYEVATSTACIAPFMRPMGGIVRRTWPDEDKERRRKKRH